ncbi:hypothetical protein DDZ18_03880 [Marinicauda salina]|uniref:O-antigen ligase-related domain-containing protein n=1 Tax=Marinicauda salina TaxID=2135793 RepID=A0A2U2BXK8_9PROT|nr:hypothetical protein DDZ18_03880 [Marinicauda salina]
MLAIEWICLSWLWSPYDRPDQLLKLALLTPLFAMIPLAAAQATGRALRTLRTMVVFSAAAALLYFLFEAGTNGVITYSFKIAFEGYTGGLEALQGHIDRNLSRGSFAVLMLSGPAAMLLWRAGGAFLRCAAVGVWLAALFASNAFDVTANMIAFLAATGAAALAIAFPRRTLQAALVVTALSILFAPAMMRFLIDALPDDALNRLPLSWAMRIEIWRETAGLIAERPIFGHGLDAARVLSRPAELRGVEFDLIPLHAHNAGLQIWLETGLVGAMLTTAACMLAAAGLERRAPSSPVAAGLVFAFTLWVVAVSVGYGLWQEWHHAGLALALTAALSLKPDRARAAPRDGGEHEHDRAGRERFARLLAE